MVWVVSSSGWRNFGEDNWPDEYTLMRLPSTWTVSKSVASAAGPPIDCADAARGAARTRPVSSDAVSWHDGATLPVRAGSGCLRLLMWAISMPCVTQARHRHCGRTAALVRVSGKPRQGTERDAVDRSSGGTRVGWVRGNGAMVNAIENRSQCRGVEKVALLRFERKRHTCGAAGAPGVNTLGCECPPAPMKPVPPPLFRPKGI